MLKVKKQLDSAEQEKLAELWEDTERKLEAERIPDQARYENHQRQEGTWLHSNEVIRRVLRMNSMIWPEDSVNCRGHANFYYPDPITGQKRCAETPFRKGPMHECTIVYKDASGRPAPVGPGNVPIEYGWREVIDRLIKKRLITLEQARRYFPLHETQLSEPFDRQVQEFKN